MTPEKKYPIKFLDAYGREDQDLFFGRDEEVEALYEMVFQSDLILLYGQIGTGKTSLIQCGLAGKFQPYEWLALNIRRGDDLNLSLEKALSDSKVPTQYTQTIDNLEWLDETNNNHVISESTVITLAKKFYLQQFKPIFLIFDQFEEIYILGTKLEQKQFIETVRDILRMEQPIKIIISIREEYLGYLYEFERNVPELLRKKLRIEQMNLEKVQAVIQGVGKLPHSNINLRIGEEESIGLFIFEKLKDRENTRAIELPYLQVFLDKLYLQCTGDHTRLTQAEFSIEELKRTGDIGDVLRNFLDDQVLETARVLDVMPTTVKKLLAPFVTFDGTKAPLSAEMLQARLPDCNFDLIRKCLQVFQSSRILRFDEKEQRYEIAHDSLARQIASYQNEEDIAFQKAVQMIRTQMLMEVEKRDLFSETQLIFIDPYLTRIDLTEEESSWIKYSQVYRQKEKIEHAKREREKLNRKWTFRALVLTFVALATTIYFAISAEFLRKEANLEKEKFKKANIDLQAANSKLDSLKKIAEKESDDAITQALEYINVDVENEKETSGNLNSNQNQEFTKLKKLSLDLIAQGKCNIAKRSILKALKIKEDNELKNAIQRCREYQPMPKIKQNKNSDTH